jgi:hypothetical protein
MLQMVNGLNGMIGKVLQGIGIALIRLSGGRSQQVEIKKSGQKLKNLMDLH